MPQKTSPIRVLIVDDSLFMRTLLSNILNEYDDLEVVGVAVDGYDAIEKTHMLEPDVISLDLEMPRLDGISTLGYIMSECPTPVVILSALIGRGSELTIKALDFGAVDFIAKPSGAISLNIRTIEHELVAKIRAAAKVDVKKLTVIVDERVSSSQTPHLPQILKSCPLVIIGASTGGPRALSQLFLDLPKVCDQAAYVIIQHMPLGFTEPFAHRLDHLTRIKIHEAVEGENIAPGRGMLAPAGKHLVFAQTPAGICIKFDDGPREQGVKPSLNVTLNSAAKLNISQIIAIILTGMGADGAAGCQAVKMNKNAVVIAQDKASSVVYGMPMAAARTGVVDYILPLDEIPFKLAQLLPTDN